MGVEVVEVEVDPLSNLQEDFSATRAYLNLSKSKNIDRDTVLHQQRVG
jgi:hypothetical protein